MHDAGCLANRRVVVKTWAPSHTTGLVLVITPNVDTTNHGLLKLYLTNIQNRGVHFGATQLHSHDWLAVKDLQLS